MDEERRSYLPQTDVTNEKETDSDWETTKKINKKRRRLKNERRPRHYRSQSAAVRHKAQDKPACFASLPAPAPEFTRVHQSSSATLGRRRNKNSNSLLMWHLNIFFPSKQRSPLTNCRCNCVDSFADECARVSICRIKLVKSNQIMLQVSGGARLPPWPPELLKVIVLSGELTHH